MAITGPSGSGKSTLLSLVAGLEKPTSGAVTVFGHELGNMTENGLADMRRESMGFVFQNYHLIPTLTVCENVLLPLLPTASGALELLRRALQCIERVGLEKRIHHLPSELSGGEQQRVGLARALINTPKLILADEPTGNLDADSAAIILGLLFDLASKSGSTVVLTTHDPAVAERCVRRIHIEAGRIAQDHTGPQ